MRGRGQEYGYSDVLSPRDDSIIDSTVNGTFRPVEVGSASKNTEEVMRASIAELTGAAQDLINRHGSELAKTIHFRTWDGYVWVEGSVSGVPLNEHTIAIPDGRGGIAASRERGYLVNGTNIYTYNIETTPRGRTTTCYDMISERMSAPHMAAVADLCLQLQPELFDLSRQYEHSISGS